MGLGFESQPNHEINDREVLTKGFSIAFLDALDRIIRQFSSLDKHELEKIICVTESDRE